MLRARTLDSPLVDDGLRGANPSYDPFNATSPNSVRMNELCQALGDILHRPSWLPVPDFALELLLGEAAQVVLEGQQVLPQATQSMGFEFQYANLKSSLTKILSVT